MDFTNNLPLSLVFLVIGFVCLIKGADFFVDGCSSIAKRLRVPAMLIGLTIVAMGTSLPELGVSVTAAMAGNNELAISNVLGSNIFNLAVVLAMSAVVMPMTVQKVTLRRDFPISMISVALLLIFGATGWKVGRPESLILFVFFIFYLVITIRSAMKTRRDAIAQAPVSGEEAEEEQVEAEKEELIGAYRVMPVWKSLLMIGIGIVGIGFGSDWVVDSASELASMFGWSQNLIGLTIVAIGTSLPELVTSITAASKKEIDLAVGNAIGSCIFNVLLILGVSGIIHPMAFNMENAIDSLLLLGVSALIWIFGATRKRITRPEGFSLLAVYAAYMAYIIIR